MPARKRRARGPATARRLTPACPKSRYAGARHWRDSSNVSRPLRISRSRKPRRQRCVNSTRPLHVPRRPGARIATTTAETTAAISRLDVSRLLAGMHLPTTVRWQQKRQPRCAPWVATPPRAGPRAVTQIATTALRVGTVLLATIAATAWTAWTADRATPRPAATWLPHPVAVRHPLHERLFKPPATWDLKPRLKRQAVSASTSA